MTLAAMKSKKKWGGSRVGRSANISRDFAGADSKLVLHNALVSWPDSQCAEAQFKQRFRVLPAIFERIYKIDKSSTVGAIINDTLDLKTEPYRPNGNLRDWMYFLVDGIYPNWAIFLKMIPISNRRTPTESPFARKQEHIRKDGDRAVGILVKKFHILTRPTSLWDEESIQNMLCAFVTLHNRCCKQRIKGNPFFAMRMIMVGIMTVKLLLAVDQVFVGRGDSVDKSDAVSLILNSF
jgi:Plant transposon protein